jgi:hypothetical protein
MAKKTAIASARISIGQVSLTVTKEQRRLQGGCG